MERNKVAKTWAFKARLPMRKLHAATFLGERDLMEAGFDEAAPLNGKDTVWDVGTYEVIEGDFRSGEFRIYLQGAKTMGEWTVTAVDEPGRWRWQRSGHSTGKSKKANRRAGKLSA